MNDQLKYANINEANPPISISKNLIEFCINPTNSVKLNELDDKECRQILPFLTRLWYRKSSGQDEEENPYMEYKLAIVEKLRNFNDTNRICMYLKADFAQIYEDVIRHLSTRKKTQTISVYTYSEFETASPTAKLLMIANILLNGNIRSEENIVCKYSSIDYSLFDYDIYYQDLSDLLCIIHAELGEVISLSQFIFTLLHVQGPLCVNYILSLIANSVDSLFQVVDILLEGCSCSQIDMQRHKCLIAIASCWPSLSTYIIYECIRRHCLPSVILFLAREDNLINTLLSMFQFEQDRTWFVQFLRNPNKNAVEKVSVDLIREDLVATCAKCKSTPHLDLELFKLYSGLRIFAGLKFNEAEIKALIDLILNTNEITVGISFLLIYPPLYESESNSQRIIQWIKDKFNQAQQSILLVAIYSSSYQIQLLNEYASNMIGFKFVLKSNSVNSIKSIFQTIFPDDTLLNEYTRSLPITPKLNLKTSQSQKSHSNTSTSLGIYFLNQWIKTNSFINKRQFDLNTWLFQQILECVEPMHPVMLALINNYVIQLFNLNILSENRLQPLSSEMILSFFQTNYSDYDSFITPKLLLFYYLLSYEAKRRETILLVLSALQNPQNAPNSLTMITSAVSLNSTSPTAANRLILANLEALLSFKYPAGIFEHIPINYFLIKAKEIDFLIIYPGLLKCVINLFTQLCQVEHCLYEPKIEKNSLTAERNEKWKNLEYLLNKLRHIKKALVDDELTRSEAYVLKILWFKAYSVHGRKLSLKSAEIILDMPSLKYDDMYSNPLILLKSNNLEIYKLKICGPLLEIILYILKECLLTNKNQMEFYIIENQLISMINSKTSQINHANALKEKQDLKNSLLITQDTAVIQILLDLYLLIKKKSNELVSREVQCIVCSFLHQMFIDNTSLAEIVHFQGYPRNLIPILVKGVPSMHICLEFLPKLLQHYDINKQIFGINLIAHLCEKYPIVRTYNVAKLAINVAFTVLQSQTLEERKSFFSQISSALVTFYTKLPPLTQECVSLIINAIQTKSIELDSLPSLANFEI